MNFIARAGSFIDRAHRVAGFLLICCGILALTTMCQWQRNTELNRTMAAFAQRLPVIVVPGAVAGKYDPREDAQLVAAFTDFITQTMNTFTPETLAKQLDSARPYLDSALLIDSTPYFEKKMRDAEAVKRASLFVPDRSTLKVKNYDRNGVEMRDVTIQGVIQNIAAGTVAENIPIEIKLTLRKGIINPAVNPYGFMLVTYNEAPLVDRNAIPNLPPIDTSGPQPEGQ